MGVLIRVVSGVLDHGTALGGAHVSPIVQFLRSSVGGQRSCRATGEARGALSVITRWTPLSGSSDSAQELCSARINGWGGMRFLDESSNR